MTSSSENLGRWYLRSFGALAAVITALVGAITWITGWQHGQSLMTFGMLAAIIIEYWKNGPRLGFAAAYVLETQKSIRKSDHEGAAKAAGKAVRQFRKVAATRPAESWRLAASLDLQRDLLMELDRYEEALPVAREAVETWRRAAETDPARTVQVSLSLNSLAVVLGRLDREDEAMPHTTEAISVTRQLVALQEGRLALNLSNLAISLLDGRRREPALAAEEEALEIHRRNATADPELRDSAAESAKRVVQILGGLERYEEAVRAAEEWADFERALVADDPDRVPELAEAVRMLGSALAQADRAPEGKARWYEALELLRRSDEHRSAYASASNAIGRFLADIEEHEESLTVYRDGLTVRRALAEADSKHHDDFARELAGAALEVRWHDRPELAREFAAEGLAICRKHPDSTTSYALLRVLQELAAAHKELGELEPAAALGEEVLVLVEEFTTEDPGQVHHLIRSLEEQAVLLHRLGRSDQARQLELKGVGLTEQHNTDAD